MIAVAIHCLITKEFPKNNTDTRTVKNFLIVATIDAGRVPNKVTVDKRENCPQNPHTERAANFHITVGWRCKNEINCTTSREQMHNNTKQTDAHLLILVIIDNALVWKPDFILSWTAAYNPSKKREDRTRNSPIPKP